VQFKKTEEMPSSVVGYQGFRGPFCLHLQNPEPFDLNL